MKFEHRHCKIPCIHGVAVRLRFWFDLLRFKLFDQNRKTSQWFYKQGFTVKMLTTFN